MTIALLNGIYDTIAAKVLAPLIIFILALFLNQQIRKLLQNGKKNHQKTITLSGQNPTYTGDSSMENSITDEPIESTVKNLLDIHGKWLISDIDASLRIIKSGYRFSKEELLKLENSGSERAEHIIHTLAECGYVFTFDELMILKNPIDSPWGNSIAHLMVNNGCFFSVDQILELGDTKNREGLTISLIMARHGYQFTFEEILRLENPADNFGVTLAHLSIHKPAQIGYRGYHEMWISHSGQAFEKYEYAIFNHSFERVFQNPQFTIEQLIQLGNPADDDGDTVAHLMAKTGYIFTNNELMELGEQRNKLGETVADIMAHKNYKIPNSEVEKSDLPLEQLPINDYLDIKDSRPIYGVECPGWAYDFYFNGRVTYNYCDWGMDTMIKIMNQEAWSIYLDYLEKTYPGQIIDMKFVESIGKKYR